MNQIEDVPDGIFKKLGSLKVLKLGANLLTMMAPKSLIGLEKLEEISLYGNQLKTIPAQALNKLTNLRYLDLAGNQIKYVNCWGFGGL